LGQPDSILAANDPQNALALDPNFIAGTLVRYTNRQIEVYAEGYGPPVAVRLTEQTQICCRHLHCDCPVDALKIGDRVDVSTYSGLNGRRIARWLNANFIATIGMISAMRGNVVYVEGMPGMYDRPSRELTIMPYTLVTTKGGQHEGRSDLLNVGDMIHYTALADEPDMDVLKCRGGSVCVLYPEGS